MTKPKKGKRLDTRLLYRTPFGTCGKPGHAGCLDSRLKCGHDMMDASRTEREREER